VNFHLKVLIDKEDNSDSIPVNLESVIKPIDDITNHCKKNCLIVMLLVKKQVSRL
jgi:hypothetical protein